MRPSPAAVLLLTLIAGCGGRADELRVRPSCYRSEGQGEFWVHVRQPFSYDDGSGKRISSSNLVQLRCRRRDQTWDCHGISVDLDNRTLGFMDVGILSIQVARHRDNLTILDWGNHTISVRWDKGTVETTYDEGESLVATKYETATCGKAVSIGTVRDGAGLTWIWGQAVGD